MIKIFNKIKYLLLTIVILFSLLFFYTVSSSEVISVFNYEDNNIRNNNALESNYISPNSIKNEEKIAQVFTTEDDENSEAIDIKQKLNDITKQQNFSIGRLDNAMDALKDRSKLKTFLIGNNLGILRFQIVQITDQARILEELIPSTTNITDKDQINEQIKFLKDKRLEVEKFIFEQENEFSLFGWFVGLL